jgi:hypothetical protein
VEAPWQAEGAPNFSLLSHGRRTKIHAIHHSDFYFVVNLGYGSREELTAAGATLFCQRPEMLGEILSSHFGERKNS